MERDHLDEVCGRGPTDKSTAAEVATEVPQRQCRQFALEQPSMTMDMCAEITVTQDGAIHAAKQRNRNVIGDEIEKLETAQHSSRHLFACHCRDIEGRQLSRQ